MRRNNFSDDDSIGIRQKSFDIAVIMNFLFLNIIYAGAAFFVRNIIFTQIVNSPTRKLGNEIIALYRHNDAGVLWNMFQSNHDALEAMSFLAVAVVAFIVIMNSSKMHQSLISALAFFTSGIILHIIDRTMYGYVIDYIKLGIFPSLPMFNIADIMIIAGILGVINSAMSRKWAQ